MLKAMVEHPAASIAELSVIARSSGARTSTRLTKLAEQSLVTSPMCVVRQSSYPPTVLVRLKGDAGNS